MEVETLEHAGLTIRIWAEEYIEEWMSPREDYDGLLGVMFCDHPDYNLGDKDAPDPRDQTVTCDHCKGSGESKLFEIFDNRAYGHVQEAGTFASRSTAESYIELNAPEDSHWYVTPQDCPTCKGNGEVEVGIVEYLKREHGARVILPLFLYDHSGITMRAGGRLDMGEDDLTSRGRFVGDDAGWDTSTVGVVFDTTESRERCGWENRTDDEIEADLRSEVEYYAAYLEGGVYGYDILRAVEDEGVLLDADTREELNSLDDAEEMDSMGGMLDPDIWSHEKSYVIQEAKSAAECCIDRLAREQAERHEWECRDVVTV